MTGDHGVIGLSVRAFVEHAHLSGSIDSGFRTMTSLTEGTRAHLAVQSEYEEPDRKEVHLEGELEHEELVFRLEGRCDGLRFEGSSVIIEEIKSTSGELANITEDSYPVHWAQAACYAYLYASREGLSVMRLRLVYVQVATSRQLRFEREATLAGLEADMKRYADAYAPFARLELSHMRQRDASIKGLAFPFPAYRGGQRQFAGAVYTAIAQDSRLFARAPTGTGKTISTLFPAVKAMGEGLLKRMFYLSAKTLTRTAAEEAFALMKRGGLHLRSVTLTAKDKICFQEETRCDKEHCPFADGHYDRVQGALLDMLKHETSITRETVEKYARKHTVCPFEFSLDAAYAADAVLCDYNYIYDPRVYLKRQPEEVKRHAALLVDEAHNLVDRGREMYSAELTKAPFLALQRAYKGVHVGLHGAAKAVNEYFVAWRKARGDAKQAVDTEPPEGLGPLIEAFAEAAERELSASEGSEARQLLLDTYFACQRYTRVLGTYDERFVTLAEWSRSDVRVKLFCLDPSALLRQMTKGYKSQVFFSATLSPLGYYRDMLGGEEDDYAIAIPSPFHKDQLEVRLLPVSTRYRDREASKPAIADMLHALIEERPGNRLVFFPSYEYMNEVLASFMERSGGRSGEEGADAGLEAEAGAATGAGAAEAGTGAETKAGAGAEAKAEAETGGGGLLDVGAADILIQQGDMSEEERERFLAEFRAGRDKPLLGFAVMGGIFSEGIDLTGERLTGVIIVGVGLPQIGLERDAIKSYFDAAGKSGFNYAYVYPGINKVLQAGGRLIRTEQDRGTLVLIDDRFLQPSYQRLLPEEWKPLEVVRKPRQR
ncbi:Rad3-related DNA helicase [Paenibacillus sp. UNCCL117]|nr:Rad3-related DNA helicase [Paenibacillus sp. cl123]SFW33875.1 Rad3-related DNA helicase [Paenibacillus sp. UNCCL117]